MSREDESNIELATDLTALGRADQPKHSTVFRKAKHHPLTPEQLNQTLPARLRRLIMRTRKAYEGKVI